MKSAVSVTGAITSALRFLLGNPITILRLAIAPLVLGWVTLYLALDAYLDELAIFLRSPNGQVGSLALGLIALGLFLTLLFHCVLAVGLTEAALDRPRDGNRFFRAGILEWRLYAAYLRVLFLAGLAVGIPVAVGWATARGMTAAGHPEAVRWTFSIAYAAMLVALVTIAVRVRFLLAPVVVMETGSVLRRSLALSSGNGLRVLAITAICLTPAMAVQLLAETAAHHVGLMPPVQVGASFETLVGVLRGILPEFVTISMASYFVSLVLLVGAAAAVYRARTEQP
jgi:hypothetical protein